MGEQFLWGVNLVKPHGPAPLETESAAKLSTEAAEDKKETESSEITENFYLLQPVVFELQGYTGTCNNYFLRDQYEMVCIVHNKPRTNAFLNNKCSRRSIFQTQLV